VIAKVCKFYWTAASPDSLEDAPTHVRRTHPIALSAANKADMNGLEAVLTVAKEPST